ncbi:MAG: outer membrane protein assembly factor BamD [Candidatus Acidiferrales bacterium]
MKEKRTILAALLGVCLFFGFCLDADAQLKKKITKKKKQAVPAEDLNASSEPDKLLYDRAQEDLKHSRYTEGRLALQTLINTYPDSEYLAKAKLAVADSYFKEGGVSNLTQSISEYKDFNTFFPFLDEAAYAQMQIGMAHYKMMEKADRDNAQAQMAEDELQTMLLKYPQSPLAPQASQRLREVQEVLADGDYKVAKFYYAKGDTHAAGARLIELTDRYPLYSQTDEALWLLGDLYIKTKLATKDEDARNLWAVQAARCYSRIVAEYPLSKHSQDAKARLKGMGAPVPAIDPDALARMQKEQAYAKEHHSTFTSLMSGPKGMLHGAPDVSTAAHSGQPNLNPPTDAVSATEVLKPSYQKPGGNNQVSSGSGSAPGGNGPTSQIDAQTSGPSGGTSTGGMQAGVQIITPLENGQPAPAASAPATSAPASSTVAPAASAPTAAPAPAAAEPANTAAPSGNSVAASPSTPAAAQPASQSSQGGDSSSSQAAQGATPAAASQKSSDSDDDKNESTSKKKKGLRKLVPW